MLDLVENDFNVAKSENTPIFVEEVREDVYDASLTVLMEEFNYLEIFDDTIKQHAE